MLCAKGKVLLHAVISFQTEKNGHTLPLLAYSSISESNIYSVQKVAMSLNVPATGRNKLVGLCIFDSRCPVRPGDVRSLSKPVQLYRWACIEHSDTNLQSSNFEK